MSDKQTNWLTRMVLKFVDRKGYQKSMESFIDKADKAFSEIDIADELRKVKERKTKQP